MEDFRAIKDLGKGRFGQVKLVVYRETGMIFSLKIVAK